MKLNLNERLKERLFEVLSVLIVTMLFIYTNAQMGNPLSVGIVTIIVGIAGFIVYLKEWVPNRIVKGVVFSLILVSIMAFFLADIWFYRYYATPMNSYLWMQKSNLNGLGESIFSMVDMKDVVFLLAGIPIAESFMKKKYPLKHMALIPALLFLMIAGLKPVKNIFIDKVDITRRYEANTFLRNWGPIGHHVLDTYAYFSDSGKHVMSADDKKAVAEYFNKKTKPVHDLSGSLKGKNLILIQVESLQAFPLFQESAGQEVTPFMNELAKGGLYFPHVYPQTVFGNSSDGELIANTGLYPLKQGATFFRFPYNDFPGLAKELKKSDYESFAFHGDEEDFWNRQHAFPSLGFSDYYSIEDMKQDEMISMGLGDRSFFNQSFNILKDKKDPYYAFFVTLTSHVPFSLPKEKITWKSEAGKEGSYLTNYFEAMHYTDSAIGGFVKQLKDAGKLKNSVIVIYGDHDGLFLKDKHAVEAYYGTKISDDEWVAKYMPIPVIIYQQDMEGKTIEKVAGQVDILPTLYDLFDIKSSTYFGESMLNGEKGGALILKGDYGSQMKINAEGRVEEISPKDQKEIDLSDQVIITDYFKQARD
ncbi:LTA synthase family protein [Peribacillus muralis]|uniref:LTA synthase family protein n=1 Tax=Peribacillus muralis TaxID=264697 RepID=UPI001F4D5AAA|nr:LTA synthase family protein [Peribacillus muralis]MCK1994481.1 LTA synthase family protein [Peribacillus muralis]MCK2015285.1 LTA synthase family protein [Peribacillus muralis]